MPYRSSLEAALARLSAREALAAEAERIARIGTFVYDLKTRIAERSEEMVRIWGLDAPEGESTLETILQRVHPDEHAQMAADYERLMTEGQGIDREHRIVMDDGEVRHVHIRGEVVQLEGRSDPTLIGTIQDITEQRRALDIIASQTARLKEMQSELIFLARQSAMGTMAATLAHELNQPLTAIASYATGLRRMLGSPREEELMREGLTALQENALRAGEIIRRMREMARQGEVRKEDLDLEQLAQEAAHLAAIGHGNVRFDFGLGHGGRVRGDSIQIQQVLLNLLKNAAEALEDRGGGTVTVTSRDANGAVEVCVADTGPGIPEDLFPSLFEAKVSTKPGGMGIGLSISRTIIEAHGGSIRAENVEDGGARFCVTLPAD